MMALSDNTPIVIGVGDKINRSTAVEDAIEPLELMLAAVEAAIADTGASKSAQKQLRSEIDSIETILNWTWPYTDLQGLLAQRLGVDPQYKQTSPHGGNQPVRLFDEASRRISQGKTRIAVITGGEALASLVSCAAKGKLPPPGWSETSKSVDSVFSPTTRELGGDLGGIHGIGAPIQVYPLYENAFRAARKQTIEENNQESASLYAEFAQVAEKNSSAWNYGKPAATAEDIGTVSKKNRMICLPYRLLMNAFNNINLAGACILTSIGAAEELGIPRSNWIYPLGGAGTRDAYAFWERPSFNTSPSISQSLDAALEVSQLTKSEIDLYDFYSCFPIVPKLACHHLGLPFSNSAKPITLLGGLTSFGGAGNNYSTHAIIEMVRHLRQGKGQTGLILANGGSVTYQYVTCLSSNPRKDESPYPEKNPLPESLESIPHPEVDREPEGEAVIETYTVDFDRSGNPSTGYVVGRLKSTGHRFLANDADPDTLRQLASTIEEQIGKSGWVYKDSALEQRSLFSFKRPQSKL